VLTPRGDVVKESIGAFPRVLLAEGEVGQPGRRFAHARLLRHEPKS
jgi:hypothetical protein